MIAYEGAVQLPSAVETCQLSKPVLNSSKILKASEMSFFCYSKSVVPRSLTLGERNSAGSRVSMQNCYKQNICST